MQSDAPQPLAVDADGFAQLANISRAMVHKLNASGRCPAPVRIGRLCRWRVSDISAWLEQGCPPRDTAKAAKWAKAKSAELARISSEVMR
jgi:predicted DNA-binding transcriptional regulator AlpA